MRPVCIEDCGDNTTCIVVVKEKNIMSADSIRAFSDDRYKYYKLTKDLGKVGTTL